MAFRPASAFLAIVGCLVVAVGTARPDKGHANAHLSDIRAGAQFRSSLLNLSTSIHELGEHAMINVRRVSTTAGFSFVGGWPVRVLAAARSQWGYDTILQP